MGYPQHKYSIGLFHFYLTLDLQQPIGLYNLVPLSVRERKESE